VISILGKEGEFMEANQTLINLEWSSLNRSLVKGFINLSNS
jgi:hypothetical protein